MREYLIPPPGPTARATIGLADLLVLHGIEVRRAEEPVKVGTRTLPAGTLVIPLAQPSSRLLRNLIEPTIQMDEKFLKEQERRRQKRLGDQIYDMTAWSLPLLFDLEVVTVAQPSGVKASIVTPPAARGRRLAARREGRLPAALGQRGGGRRRRGAAGGHPHSRRR